MINGSNPALAQPPLPDQTITDLAQRTQVLRRLLDSRCLLSVSLSNHNDSFLSTILAVDKERLSLDIDELNPHIEAIKLLNSQHLDITGQLEGVSVRFSARVNKVQTRDETAYYTLAFPAEIYYAQQRQHYRIYLGMLQRPEIQLENEGHPPIIGEVVNISLGGAMVLLPHDAKADTFDQTLNCQIIFRNGKKFTATIEIRHQRAHPKTGQIEISILFLKLSRAQEKELQKHTAYLERENVRSN
ncbi:MAG: flagellar brake protein [Porticoccaceae bacterium]|nr:flagellar brake protein [Porticoccaceae bacterium]